MYLMYLTESSMQKFNCAAVPTQPTIITENSTNETDKFLIEPKWAPEFLKEN